MAAQLRLLLGRQSRCAHKSPEVDRSLLTPASMLAQGRAADPDHTLSADEERCCLPCMDLPLGMTTSTVPSGQRPLSSRAG